MKRFDHTAICKNCGDNYGNHDYERDRCPKSYSKKTGNPTAFFKKQQFELQTKKKKA